MDLIKVNQWFSDVKSANDLLRKFCINNFYMVISEYYDKDSIEVIFNNIKINNVINSWIKLYSLHRKEIMDRDYNIFQNVRLFKDLKLSTLENMLDDNEYNRFWDLVRINCGLAVLYSIFRDNFDNLVTSIKEFVEELPSDFFSTIVEGISPFQLVMNFITNIEKLSLKNIIQTMEEFITLKDDKNVDTISQLISFMIGDIQSEELIKTTLKIYGNTMKPVKSKTVDLAIENGIF